MAIEKMHEAKVDVDLIRARLISKLRTYELPEDVAALLAEHDAATERFHDAWVAYENSKLNAAQKKGGR